MSKIQKAIREMEKARQAGQTGQPVRNKPVGRVVESNGTDELPVIGDDTRELASLGTSALRKKITVDREELRDAGFIAPEDEERLLIDQYRQIKRPLIAHAFGKRATKVEDGHLILVTSALPGDGKTFSCINLALSLAQEQDRSVLLVDADVAKAHVSRLFGAEEEPGLLDLLEENCPLTLDEVVLNTDVKGLSLMTAGDMRRHSTELLASERMERLIRALGAQDPNRLIVFDSSPLLSTSESRVLATLVGQIVMVVCAGQTPQQAVLSAIDLVDENKALNLILNQSRQTGTGEYYGNYGYGYGERE